MASKNDTPCYGCMERHQGCHSYCKNYLDFRAKNLERYEKHWYDQEVAYLREVNDKIKKKQRRHNK